MRKIILYIIFFSLVYFANGQILFEQGMVQGGVTAGGFSTGQGFGSGTLNLYIEPGSTIKKAYLFTYRVGYPPNIPINLNGTSFLFDTTNSIMNVNHANSNASPIHLYYNDITSYLNSNLTTTFNIIIPTQNGLPINWGYWTLFVYIIYEHPALNFTNYAILVNDNNFNGNEIYSTTNLNPINTTFPVGFSLYTDRTGSGFVPNEDVYFNSNYIGRIGGSDAVNNLWNGAGVKGHFYYQNNTLFGLDDDVANNTMDSTDGLADVFSYLSNNTTSCNFNLRNWLYPNMAVSAVSAKLAYFLTYTTPCDTFTTTATTTQDTICLGDSVQLNATGGSTYSWFGAFGGLNDTSIANPTASPPQTTTYIVTIKNDSGCVKTEHVKIWVTQPIDSITTTPTICGIATGSITAHYNTNANYNFTLYDTNFNPLANNTTGVFNQLAEGTYIVENTLHNCTFYDTITVNAINNVVANFYNLPQAPWNNPNQALGKAPMEVSFFNTSQNANMFQWSITQQPNNDTIIQYSTFNIQHFLEEGGVYEVCLIAYNNQPQCADTSCKTIFIDPNEEISIFIPNVFTPNGDNENDNFIIQLAGVEYLKSLEVEVFNRWGQRVSNYELAIENSISNLESPISNLTIWNGTTNAGATASEGTYFYVISYTTKAGEIITEKGTVSLLR